MRNPDGLAFWSALGRACCGVDAPLRPTGAPWEAALASPPPLPGEFTILAGEPVRPRKVWAAAWKVLEPLGFSRALRLEPLPGILLYLPFHREGVAVLPQGFPDRIPPVERAWALVGRSAAALASGFTLVVVPAHLDDRVRPILENGRVTCATPDRLAELLP